MARGETGSAETRLLLIVPKGTPHGDTIETSGHLKILAIKTPPQDSTDIHPLQ